MVKLGHIVVAIAMILSIMLPGCGEERGWDTEGIRDRFIEILQPTDEQLEQLEAGTGTLQLREDQVDTLSDYVTPLLDDLQPRLEQAQWQEVEDILEGMLTQGEVDLQTVGPVTEAIHDSLSYEAEADIGVYANLVRLSTESTATVEEQTQLAEGSQRSTCITLYTPRNQHYGDKLYESGGDEMEDTVGWQSTSIAAADSYSGAIGVDVCAGVAGGAGAYALQRILINIPNDATDIDITTRLLYSDGTFSLFPCPLGCTTTGIITVCPYQLHQDATILEQVLDPFFGWDDALKLALMILGLGFGGTVIGAVADCLSWGWTGLDAVAYLSALQDYGESKTVTYSADSLPAGDYIFEIGVYARVESYLDFTKAHVIGLVRDIEVSMNIPSLTLDIASTDGGYVIEPGEGTFPCCPGEEVDIVAVSYQGYRFTGWTGDVDTIDRADIQSTYITMNDNYSITANFEEIPPEQFDLTIYSSTGGVVTTPGEGTFSRDSGTMVDLVAVAEGGYYFDHWSGDVGTIADTNDPTTTITIIEDCSITANFEIIVYGSITAHKFNDLNGNGNQDGGEPDLSNWTMSLYSDPGCSGELIDSASTDGDGNVVFTGLDAGTYSVRETLKDGWINTTELCQQVTIDAGESATLDFGNVEINPDIDVDKTASPPSGGASTSVTFTIIVTNTGDVTLGPVIVVDTLPDGMSYVSDDRGGTESPEGTITWNIGALDSGDSTTIHLMASIDGDELGVLTNGVTATGTPPEGDDVEDTDTADVLAIDARISIFESGVNPVGQSHDFTITVEKYLSESTDWVPAAGVIVTPAHSGAGFITSTGPYVTNGLGQVTVTVNSYVVGTATVHASATVSIDDIDIDVATDGYGAYIVDNQKMWVF